MTRVLSGLSILGVTLAFLLALSVSNTVNAMPGTDDGLTFVRGGGGGAGSAGGMGGAGGVGAGNGPGAGGQAGMGMGAGGNRGSVGPDTTGNGMGTGRMGTGQSGAFGGDRGAAVPDSRGLNENQGFNESINPRLNQGFDNGNPQPGIR